MSRRGSEPAAGKRRCFCGKSVLGKHDLARDPNLPAWPRCRGRLRRRIVQRSIRIFPIAARQAGLEILGISLVTNLAAGISPTPLSHAEVIEAGQAAGPRISALLANIVGRI